MTIEEEGTRVPVNCRNSDDKLGLVRGHTVGLSDSNDISPGVYLVSVSSWNWSQSFNIIKLKENNVVLIKFTFESRLPINVSNLIQDRESKHAGVNFIAEKKRKVVFRKFSRYVCRSLPSPECSTEEKVKMKSNFSKVPFKNFLLNVAGLVTVQFGISL